MTPAPLLTRPFVFAFLANMFQGMAFSLFLHFPGFLLDLGAHEVQIGLIVGAAAISSVVVRPIIGTTMDTIGRRPVVLTGNVLNVGVLLLYLTVDGIGVWVYVVQILHGVAAAMLFTALFTYGADVVPAARRTEGIALFGVSGLVPIALAGLIGDLVLGAAGFRELFLLAFGFGAAALAVSLFLPEQLLPSAPGDEVREGFFRAVTRRSLLPIWWISFAFSMVLTGYFTFLRTYVDETGIGSVGVFFGFYAGTAVLLRLLFAWVPARIGERRALFPALASLATGFVVLAAADSSAGFAAAGIMCGLGHGYAFPILFGFTVERSSVRDRGSALAFFTALFDVGTLVGGPVLGAMIAAAGYPAMYVTAAGLLVGATALFAAWDRPQPAGRVEPLPAEV